MNDNTVLRIKVPAHLYESVKEQLTLKEAKGKTHYGAGMEVVKEKKMKTPKDGMHKVEEVKEEMPHKKERSLEELKAVKEKLEKKINEMDIASKVEEKEDIKEYVGMSPDQVELVNTLGQLIAGGAASATVIAAAKNLLDMIKGGKKPMGNKVSEKPVEEAKEKKEEDK